MFGKDGSKTVLTPSQLVFQRHEMLRRRESRELEVIEGGRDA